MATNQPVLVGQRVKSVRRMTVAEQSELGWDRPTRTGPVVVELDSGVRLFALTNDDLPGKLAGHKGGETFDVAPSGVEVEG